MNDDTKILVEKLDTLREGYHDIDKKLELTYDRLERHLKEDSENLANITRSLEAMNNRLDIYNSELSKHIAGVNELRQSNQLLKQYIDSEKEKNNNFIQSTNEKLYRLEKPFQWFNGTKNAAIWISAVLGAGVAIGMAIKWLVNL